VNFRKTTVKVQLKEEISMRGYYEIAKEDKLAARKWKNCFKYANIDSKKGV